MNYYYCINLFQKPITLLSKNDMKFNQSATLLIVALVLLAPWFSSCSSGHADVIYFNATIYTMDEQMPMAEAVAVKDGKFIFVGNNDEAMELVGSGTMMVDLEGKTILPGLTESHMHFDNLGRGILTAPLDVYWLPLEELVERVGQAALAAEEGEWIIARGYNDALFDEPAHRSMLDAVSPNNPVVLRRYCGHAHWANSRALELAGIDVGTPDPNAGTIVRDAAGDATGVLVSAAGALVNTHVPPTPSLTEAEELEALRLGSDALLAAGITTVHCASGIGLDEVELRKKAFKEGMLRVRVMDAIDKDAAKAMGKSQIGLFGDRYTVRWVKMFVDGSLGGRGAALLEPYADAPAETGALRPLGQDEDGYASLVADLLQIGFTTRTHSIGDRGNRITLNAFERAMEMSGIASHEARLVVEHAQVLHPDDLSRFRGGRIIASMQPVHATEDMLFVEDRIGQDRAALAYAWRSIIDLGGIITAGSDYGVSPFNPFYGLHAAVTRQDRNNTPQGGWFPEQKMTREEALKAYTVWPAYVEFSENTKGSISSGKLADFIVTDSDYFKIPAEDIHKIQVLKTIVAGETVFKQ